MPTPESAVDRVLKSLASQSFKQGSDVRTAVRNQTLKTLQPRELTLDQIGCVLRSVAEGVTAGVATREIKVEKVLVPHRRRHGRRVSQGRRDEQRRLAQADG